MSRAHINSSFFYIANKSSGGKAFGVRTARSHRALGAALRKERQILVKTWKLPAWATNETEMSLKDHAEFDAQLAQLLERGVPLTESLEVASSVVRSANEDRVMRLRSLVAQGTSFSDACGQVGSFDEVTCAVYKAAEKTGDLAGACAQLSIGAKRRLEVSGKAATLMIYPCIVLSIAFIAGLVMMTLVVPTIGESMASSGIEVPTFTKILVTAGSFLRANIIILLGAIVAIAVAMFLWRGAVAKLAVSLTRNMPFVRDVVLEQELTRFFSVMGSMTRSGIVLSDAISVSSGVIGHPKLSKDLRRLQQRLIEGGIFRTLIEQVSALPLATRKLLVAADQAGDLESAFDSLAKDHAQNVDKKTSRLMALLEPLLIVILFLIVGTMILAIMLPMMNMTGSVL